jgi:hypothetical protein
MKNLKLLPILLSLFIIGFVACDKEEDDKPTNETALILNNDRATIQFNPSDLSFFGDNYPDSATIDITSGVPPYIIQDYNGTINPVIKGNKLIIYFTSQIYFDEERDYYVNISDNAGNRNAFNYRIKTRKQFYNNLSINSLVIRKRYDPWMSFDTVYLSNEMTLNICSYDPFRREVQIKSKTDSLTFQTTLIDFSGSGSYDPYNERITLINAYTTTNDYFKYKSGQRMYVDKFSSDTLILNVANTIENSNDPHATYTIQCIMTFTKN